jgi:putative membrane protein
MTEPGRVSTRGQVSVSQHPHEVLMSFLVHWLIVAVALWVTATIVPGVVVASYQTLALASLVLGLVNALVKPVLLLLTLPLTILTLGLFYFVVNGIAFALAAALVPGFSVASFGTAILGALVVSVVSWAIGALAGNWRGSSAGLSGSVGAYWKIRAWARGHQRSCTLPMMYFFGTSPQCRLSELLFRWSPMTK